MRKFEKKWNLKETNPIFDFKKFKLTKKKEKNFFVWKKKRDK